MHHINVYAAELEMKDQMRKLEQKAATAWMFEPPHDARPRQGRRVLQAVGALLIAAGQRLRGPELLPPPARAEDLPSQA
jgi:hypothetical protein